MEWRVPLADLNFGIEEEKAVLDVISRRWLTMGAVTQEFEEAFAHFTGVKHALAVTNATVGLHLACLALGIGPGDEVIVPSLTFVATSNSALYTGAEVRFADILGPEELNISPEEIEKNISSKTKAISVVHYGGYPCRMPEILDIARRHHLAVIEDAAHSPGASLDGKSLGTWGDVGVFSFFSNKNLSTGEGGMIVTNRDDIAAKVRLLRSHGMTTLTWDRHQGHAHSYDVVDLGYNYRIDEIRSAMGIEQLKKLVDGNTRRKEITGLYWQKFKEMGLETPFSEIQGTFSYHIFPLLLPEGVNRTEFIDRMKAAGIQTSIHYPPIHHFQYYRQRYPGVTLPKTEIIGAREVTLPLYPTMSDRQVEFVIETIRAILKTVSR